MEIQTKRFGRITVRESDFIVMKGSILGYEQLKRFVLLHPEEETPLWWLQSVDEPALAFIVVNPRVVNPGFAPTVTEEDLQLLGIRNPESIALLSIVTIRSDPCQIASQVTANLRAPILINAENRWAAQVILDDPAYPVQYDIFDNMADLKKGMSEQRSAEGGFGIDDPPLHRNDTKKEFPLRERF